MTAERDLRPQLRALSRVLQDVHRSLIDFTRERYELVHGVVRSKHDLLALLMDDEAFAWLKPLSNIIVEIDELAARDDAPTDEETDRLHARVEALFAASNDPDAFGSRYISLLPSEPRVAMHHGDLRASVSLIQPRQGS